MLFLSLIFINRQSLISLFQTSNPPVDAQPVLPTPTITAIVPLKKEYVGWIAAWDTSKTINALPDVMAKLRTFEPMLYRVMQDSSLGRHTVRNRDVMLAMAREQQLPILPVITDESDPDRIKSLLTDSDVQETFIDQLINEAKQENLTGWSIDIEKLTSSDRDDFTGFIQNCATRLHDNDLLLNVIVYGREEKESYDPARAHDFQALGKYADQIQIMTYNYNNELTEPGGQTPLPWFRRVLQYAVKTVPKEKILVGLSTHGYDWGNDEITGVTFPEAEAIINRYKGNIRYDSRESSAVYTYDDDAGSEHELWYEDARTLQDKVNIAEKEFGVSNFAFWRIGAEDPTLWERL